MFIPLRVHAAAVRIRTPLLALLCAAAATATLGCTRRAERGIPLYAPDGQTRQQVEVAQLIGDFATIDGQDVSGSGQKFELLPGCHVVVPRATGTRRGGMGIAQSKPATLTFAIQMQANRLYAIDYVMTERAGRGAVWEFVAEEKDAAGAFVAALQPTQSKEALSTCR